MILDLFRKVIEFENIQGYDDIKDIVKRALDAEDNSPKRDFDHPYRDSTTSWTRQTGPCRNRRNAARDPNPEIGGVIAMVIRTTKTEDDGDNDNKRN